MSALDPRADRDPAEAQRLLEEQLANENVRAWRESYTETFEEILDAADEHDLTAQQVRTMWQAALGEHLADREPPDLGTDDAGPSAAESAERQHETWTRHKR